MTKQKHFYLFSGLVREASHWAHLPDSLTSIFPNCHITFCDMPGAGGLVKASTPLTIKGIVEVMRRTYLSNPNPNEEGILIGISLGGMIGSYWTCKYPEDFQKLILINTSFGDISPPHHRLRIQALIHLSKVPFMKGRAKEARILKLVSNFNHVFDETLSVWEKTETERPIGFLNTFRQLFAAFFYHVKNKKPCIPVMVLAGIHDRMVNAECSRAIAKKWEVPIFEHPTGGHYLAVDDPKWISLKIQAFVQSTEGPQA